MITLQGKGVSLGIAQGKIAWLDRTEAAIEKLPVTDVSGEVQRFNAACKTAQSQLTDLSATMAAKLGEEHAALFEVHSMMLEDEEFTGPIVKMITDDKVCAEYATTTASKELANEFAEMDDEYMSARAADIIDVAKRVVAILQGTQQDPTAGPDPVILASDDFSPSETAQFDRSKTLALLSQEGSANSHTAIFARTMGIPAVIGLAASLSPSFNGKTAAVDGETGEVFIDPTPEVSANIMKKATRIKTEKQALEAYRGKPTVSKSGKKLKVYANIGSVEDANAALANDAEGIGLFRSEFLYLGREDYPDEVLQYESYKTVAEVMAGKEVIIRTLDIGADKKADYFKLPDEQNPAMGMRALRICLTNTTVFKTQLRAIYRASTHGNISIMFPMVASLWELEEAKKIAAEVRDELTMQQVPFNPKVPLGIMIETPAAAVISDELAKEAAFFSIGTNDLTQYTLACDRQNDSISRFVDTHHDAVLRLIRFSAQNAHKAGIRCGICGALGGDTALAKTFLEDGIDELSVEPSLVLKVRKAIAEI